MLTLDYLLQNEKSLQSKINTNFGLNACKIYSINTEDIRRTEGLARDAIGKITIRELRVSSRQGNRINYNEHIDRIYIWSDGLTTKLPDEFAEAISRWLGEIAA
jgi:hypothetical protein